MKLTGFKIPLQLLAVALVCNMTSAIANPIALPLPFPIADPIALPLPLPSLSLILLLFLFLSLSLILLLFLNLFLSLILLLFLKIPRTLKVCESGPSTPRTADLDPRPFLLKLNKCFVGPNS
ncbi:uncharacterized protein LOC125026503 [Penaeus chinensis]|uniref:uncharacterized protein LOC125026503 n=1 Tax=Penaeus chinensis TaxID=139456 RepID=UPI001FB778D6|nr:uncharacterized protein LOC125026503 [Penaeus chinensis]